MAGLGMIDVGLEGLQQAFGGRLALAREKLTAGSSEYQCWLDGADLAEALHELGARAYYLPLSDFRGGA